MEVQGGNGNAQAIQPNHVSQMDAVPSLFWPLRVKLEYVEWVSHCLFVATVIAGKLPDATRHE